MRNWVWLRNEGSEGPGRASSRHVELPNSDPAPLVWRAPEGPEGLVAVPVGGGRARAGLEIDHSEPSGSRVAISRAGLRPPAHTAARPFKAGLRRPEHQQGHKHQHAARTARGRAAAHRHTERPDRTRQIMRSGRRARRAKLAARTVSGRAAAHGHTKWPGLTRQKILQPEVWQLVQRLNSAQDAQQLEPQQINEKRPPSHQHSQLHSNTTKSHMRNMRAS